MNLIGRTAEGHAIVVIKNSVALEIINRLTHVGQDCQRLAELLQVDQQVEASGSMSVDSVSPVTGGEDGRKTFTASMTVKTNDGKTVMKSMKLHAGRSKTAKAAKVKEIKALKCLGCGRTFEPHRKDQTCCSVACRKKAPKASKAKRKTKDAPAKAVHAPVIAPATAPVVKSPSPEADKRARMEILRKLVKKDSYVPPSDFGSARADYSSIPEFAQADREARRG